MNYSSQKLHKTPSRSDNMLNLRGVRTVRQKRMAEERERIVTERKASKTKTIERTPEKTARERRSIPSQYQKHFTLKVAPLKVLALFMVLALSSSAVFVAPTISLFSDSETSSQNAFASGRVDFVLEATPFESMATSSLTSEDWEVAITPHSTSNPFYYYASSTNFHGELGLCAVIEVRAILDGEVMYEGPLTDLTTGTTTVIDEWIFEFSNIIGFPGAMCHFDIDFNGWQTRHDLPERGFSDTETVNFWLVDPGAVINKVYFEEHKHFKGCGHPGYEDDDEGSNHSKADSEDELFGTTTASEIVDDVFDAVFGTSTSRGRDRLTDRDDRGGGHDKKKKDREWIELYNPNDLEIDISGWKICDNNECDTFPPSPPIPPHGFALIAGSDEVLDQMFIPDDVVVILIPDGKIGDGLHNKRDMLQLRVPDDMTVDQMNWGNPQNSWPNHDPSLWIPGLTPPDGGGVLARVPTGLDTDQPSDFEALFKPYLKITNPHKYTGKWTTGTDYTIKWEAENPNGPDEDLIIDLYYENSEGELISIVLGTENDGKHTWTLPADCGERIRIVIVATSPENPLLNTERESKRIKVKCGGGCHWGTKDTKENEVEEVLLVATTTEAENIEEVVSTTTEDIIPSATTTEEVVLEEDMGSTTKEEIIEEDTATSTKIDPRERPERKEREARPPQEEDEGILEDEEEEGEPEEDEDEPESEPEIIIEEEELEVIDTREEEPALEE